MVIVSVELAAEPLVTLTAAGLKFADAPAGKDAKPMLIEGASPGILNRIGWKFNMVKAGDKVTMVIAPLRSGEPGGLLKEIKLSDGRVFNNGGFAGPSQISLKDEK